MTNCAKSIALQMEGFRPFPRTEANYKSPPPQEQEQKWKIIETFAD
jgi:hypothetical protein